MNFNIEDLKVFHFADPRMNIRPPAFDFEKDGDKAEELATVLYAKMLEVHGAGLSANQVGLPYRVFVLGNEEKRYAFFNPEVVSVSKEKCLAREGCISMPEFMVTLSRPENIVMSFQDEAGEQKIVKLSGVPARIALHEYDYMAGINFTHHASVLKVQWELNKLKKQQKKLLRRTHNAR